MRSAREKSGTGIYHVMMRGINRQDMFLDEEDAQHFLEIIKKVKDNKGCSVYGYCLMPNHIHLLLKEEAEDLSVIMKRIGTSYAWWYNKKYDRVGHVFQNRFQSETVDTEAYLLCVLRYIHCNPVKGGLTATPEEYKWSSSSAYAGGNETTELLTTSFILDIFHENRECAIQQYNDFMQQDNVDQCLEICVKQRKSDEEVAIEVKALLKGQEIGILQGLDVAQRNHILKQLKDIPGVTQRQIARVTGIHQSIIFKV